MEASVKRMCAAVCAGVVMGLASPGCQRRERGTPADLVMPGFLDVTDAAGVAHVGPTYDAAVGDVDADGMPDVYVGNHGTGAVLLRNTGSGRFVDVLPSANIEKGGDQHGTALVDYDNDGLLDLTVTLGAGRGLTSKQNRLYHNEGGWRFQDRGATAGIADPTGRARSVAWFDADGDGQLDVFLANFATPNKLFLNRGDGSFEDASERFGVAELSATRVAWTDVDGDGYPDVLLAGTSKGVRFLHNAAGRRLDDWTARVGVARAAGSVQSMAFGDYDNDGAIDLYLGRGQDFSDVAREHAGERLTFAFFAREGKATGLTFVGTGAVDADLHVELYENGGPVAPGMVICADGRHMKGASFRCAGGRPTDVPPVGDLGFFVWRDPRAARPCATCAAAPSWHVEWRGAGDHHLSGIIHAARRPVPYGFAHPPETGGILLRGTPEGFRAVAMPVLDHDANAQAAQWSDVDNDGLLDLYVVDSGVDGAGGRNRLFLQTADHGLVAVPADAGASPSSGEGRGVGAQFLDYDGDGRQDLFLTNGWGAPPFDRGPYRLLRNLSDVRHWLDVVLQGVTSNRQGLGARVDVEACGRRQMRVHTGGSNYYSQSAIAPHFGLGDCARVESVSIRWPSGVVQRLSDVPADRVLHVLEPASTR